MQEPPNLQTENEPPQPPVQGQRFPLITVTGVVLGICLALFAARWFWGDSSPTLTPERLQQARKQWAAANIRDYRVEVAVQSRQQEVYAVEVREGRPIKAWRNGNPLQQLRTFETWSLPGIFETIESDVARQQEHLATGGPNITLRCTFDSATGAPRIYRRIEWGTDIEVSWVMKRLESLPEGKSLMAE